MINSIIRRLTALPIYPHWLEFYKREQGNNITLRNLKGKIIEVGAGNGFMKYDLLSRYKGINEYISTDCSTWDPEFERIDTKAKKFWGLSGAFFKVRPRLPIDKKCNAMDLPYKDNTFDYHLSFEVLEHIDKPYIFFKEAYRVLKRGGYMILSVPFLYRVHHSDYFRYTYNFFNRISKENNLKLLKIYSNTGFGTTFASLTNQWLILCILKSNIAVKIILLLLSPFIFFFTNTVGFLIDLKPDKNFSTRFHVIMKKL